ncbi:hypothetical protein HCN44_005134 [Aphidius gifuensis]|uniref:Ionotropic receptor n=1 Tax=Aphidius gifuensis TaxID=684658 RepID=A0A834XST3_APHGI|nr:protein croquemort-like [Aphidius gifuensis]KAF7992790.1 hypothetical protein HCN44_005134 [Aphidius gifuensis]
MRHCSSNFFYLAIIGLFALFIGSTIHIFWQKIFQSLLSKELTLRNNSRIFNIWKGSNEISMNMDFYFFNWTNPEELKLPGKKPNLIQVGPYSFIHKTEKVNIIFHPENNTVSYDTRKFWYFNPSKSNGTLNDKIFHLNVVAVTAANKVRYWSSFYQSSLSYLLNKLSEIHVVKTVDELLFKGYDDSIINMGKMAMGNVDNMPPYDKFGWFYLRNGSTLFEGNFNMATGEDDIKNIGKAKNWNYKNKTSYYKLPCNAVEGSTGEFWPPGRDNNDISIFSADLCRSVTYEYTGKTINHGIEGNKYEMGDKTLANHTLRHYTHEKTKYFDKITTTEDFFNVEHSIINIKNNNINNSLNYDTIDMGKCFCNGECSPLGLINVTACRYGAPGFISLPHFHKGDPVLRQQVNGLQPNDKDHSFYITLEPNTGIPLDVAARLQVNILLQPSNTIDLFKNVPKIYLPIMWFDLRGGTTDNLASSLRQILWLNKIGIYGSTILASIGGLMLIIIGVMQYLKSRQINDQNTRKLNMIQGNVQTEKVYMEIVAKNDENQRNDCQLYSKN